MEYSTHIHVTYVEEEDHMGVNLDPTARQLARPLDCIAVIYI
jgi:hypothetical protein